MRASTHDHPATGRDRSRIQGDTHERGRSHTPPTPGAVRLVRPVRHDGVIAFLTRLLCSDVDCAEVVLESVDELAALDRFACDCGCELVLLAVSLDAA